MLREVSRRGQTWCKLEHVGTALICLLLLLTSQFLLCLQYSIRSIPVRPLDGTEHFGRRLLGP